MVGVGLPDILMWLMGCVVCEGPMQSLAILLGLLRPPDELLSRNFPLA